MSSPGETLSSMVEASRPPQRFFALFALGLLLMALGMGAYDATQDVNGVLCTGCLALNPKPADFNGFWVEYPSRHKDTGEEVNHFDWIEDDLKDRKVVMLFFWYTGCASCEEQWEDMKDDGIVKGSEANGDMGDDYRGQVKLHSIDTEDSDSNKKILKRYEPDGDIYEDSNLPTTVILTKENSGNETIYWYADDAKLKASLVEEILDAAINNEGGIGD